MSTEIKNVSIGDIKINDANPRYITDDKFQQLVESIMTFPEMLEKRPIVVDEDMVALGGNMRLRASKAAGLKDVPIIQVTDWSEDKKRQFIIKDNVGYGQWDWDILGNEWEAEELEKWGLEIPEVEVEINLEAEEDNFEMPNPNEVNTDIVIGDLFEIGEHKLLCGDSTIIETYAALFQDEMADLVITDPPYNVAYTGGTGMTIQNDDMDDDKFYQFLYDFHTALMAYTKPGGGWYVWHADSEGLNFRKAFIESGIDLKQCLIWVKNALVMGRQDYQWKHEPCLYGWKPGAAHYFVDDRTNTTVIEDKDVDYNKMTKKELIKEMEYARSSVIKKTILHHDKPRKNDVHPTMKPIPLIGELMENSSRPGDLVADGFLGSGTTMVAAHQLKRKCYGLELDPKYCQVIIDRMIELDPTIEVKRNGEPYEKTIK